MGIIIQQELGAGAPEIDDGMFDARFDGISAESHPDWAGPNKFGGVDDGERWRWDFTIFEDGKPVFDEGGDPLEVSTLTNQSVGKKSNGYALFKGILTSGELALIDAGEPIDTSALEGRMCQVVVVHNEKGWPKVSAVLPVKGTVRKPKPVSAEE